jgi:hypothetical protein
MIKTYLEFINESRRSKPISVGGYSVEDIIKKYAPWYNVNISETFYRGIKGDDIRNEDGSYFDAFLVKPSESTRIKGKTYYNMLIDNSPLWENYPKRDRSLICSTDTRGASSYGETYRVIPTIENSVFGVCPNHDIWASFSKGLKLLEPEFHLLGLDEFESINRELFNYLSKKGVKVDNTTYKGILKAYEIFDSLTSIERDIARIRTAARGEKLINFFNDVLNPTKNGFKLINYNNSTRIKTEDTHSKRYKEVCTSADCLLIKESLFNE